MLCKVYSMGIFGLLAYEVTIETDVCSGMTTFEIVGLPDTSVKESRERVRAALKNCGFEFPISKITINLAPADIKKTGSIYDLPILLGILSSSGQLNFESEKIAFLGELSLGGEIKPVKGVLPMTIRAKEMGYHTIVIPKGNEKEGSVVKGINVFGVSHVKELIDFLQGKIKLNSAVFDYKKSEKNQSELDFCDVKGQAVAKRALEIAAAGGHNVLLIGPPGSGKSMLSKRMPSILPKLTFDESIEVTNIHSIAGDIKEDDPFITKRPFRAPHHTISSSGLIGGGSPPRPGEISLAHNGVLFLDELPEFKRDVKEVLRQPIEDGTITVSRAMMSVSFPCSITLIAAMNPCPCGYYMHPKKECSCSLGEVKRYLSKVSGPLLDRIDIHIDVSPVEFSDLSKESKEEKSCDIRQRVERARNLQLRRYENETFKINSKISSAKLKKYCKITDMASRRLKDAFDKMGLSARTYDKILKISRTIADLDNSPQIDEKHIFEAIQYRSVDKKYFNH